MQERGIKVFGPSYKAAKLEGSKGFAKTFMKRHGIPTAHHVECDSLSMIEEELEKASFPCVIKADGLAAGKGVKVCHNKQEAISHAQQMKDIINSAGKKGRFIIEEFLSGEEASLLIFTDGKDHRKMIYTRDHKRALDGDRGENTGGMGAVSRPPISDKARKYIDEKIVLPTVEGLRKEGLEYNGVLYIGLMIKEDKAWVIEYNVRFGDPETQVILPLLKTDLGLIIERVLAGEVNRLDLEWEEREAVCVVLASGGYPGRYEKGFRISVNRSINALLFYAGVAEEHRHPVTAGGRVISVVARAKSHEQARRIAYRELKKVSFDNMHFRKDIGGVV